MCTGYYYCSRVHEIHTQTIEWEYCCRKQDMKEMETRRESCVSNTHFHCSLFGRRIRCRRHRLLCCLERSKDGRQEARQEIDLWSNKPSKRQSQESQESAQLPSCVYSTFFFELWLENSVTFFVHDISHSRSDAKNRRSRSSSSCQINLFFREDSYWMCVRLFAAFSREPWLSLRLDFWSLENTQEWIYSSPSLTVMSSCRQSLSFHSLTHTALCHTAFESIVMLDPYQEIKVPEATRWWKRAKWLIWV